EQRVRVEISDHVAVVTLTRPDKHNALDIPMFDGIIAAAEEVGAAPGVRAVVICGEGKSFCSGLDIAGVMASSPDGNAISGRLSDPAPNYFQRVAYDWVRLPVPVIAAIHGNCL